jgi:hypothetical protein
MHGKSSRNRCFRLVRLIHLQSIGLFARATHSLFVMICGQQNSRSSRRIQRNIV